MSLQDSNVNEDLECSRLLPNDPAAVARRIYQASSYGAIRQLRCEFEAGVLIISGRVPNYYLKQVAQTLVHNMDGVQRILNEVDVQG